MIKTDEIFIEEVKTVAPTLSVLEHYRGVKEEMSFRCTKCEGIFISTPDKILRGKKCPYCSGKKALSGFNDLLTLRPDIAKEWDQLKNGDLHPCDVTSNSTKRVWFICPKGHSYDTSVRLRTHGGGCPYCAGKRVLQGYNDLKTTHPEIAMEWHPTKNPDLKPTEVTSGSNKKVWWKCSKCGHEWEASVTNRVSGGNCPICGIKKSAEAKYKPVLCIETGMHFESCKSAGQHYNIKNPSSSVAGAARTGRKAGGYHWQFIDDDSCL